MISELQINDLGVISQARVPLGPGFNVLTGETGAGKTMVVTALGLLLGQRADTARVRQGSEQAWVEGHFHIPQLHAVAERVEEVGGAIEDGDVVLARQVSPEGRSRAVVGGRSAPVSVLHELSEHLVVVHGQSDQIRLRSESAQRDALDRYAGEALATVLGRYRELFSDHQSHAAELAELDANREARRAEAEQLRNALERIEAIRPQAGEDVSLRALSDKLESIEELRLAASAAYQALSSDIAGPDHDDARSLLDQAIRSIEKVIDADPDLAGPLQSLRDAAAHLDDASAGLSGYLTALTDGEGTDLESVMARRAEITGLMRDFGPTLDDVLAFEQSASDTLLRIDTSGDRRAQLEATVADEEEKLAELARQITSLRTRAAEELGGKVTAELHALAMPDSKFVVQVSPREASLSGADQVVFLLSAHSGAEPRPLAKTASGGELSRVMLALEVVVAEADPVPTFIFDEVDSGVGGATALEIGARLARLAESAQVICVTHLAQVAAHASHHINVVKDRSGEVTHSSVRVLHGEERVAELARMLGGDAHSDSARAHAREMLQRETVSRTGG